MKMNKTILILMSVGTLIALSVSARTRVTAPASNVDFPRVNFVLKSIMDEVIAEEGADEVNADLAVPYFDPARSSLDRETLAYTMAGSMKNGPWSSDGKATLSLDTYFETNRAARNPGIDTTITSTVGVDFLAAARYAGSKALEKTKYYDREYEMQIKSLLERLSRSTTLEAIYNLSLETQNLSVQILERNLKTQRDYLDCLKRLECGTVKVDEWGNHVYDEAQVLATKLKIADIQQNKASILASRISFSNNKIEVTNLSPEAIWTRSTSSDGEIHNVNLTITPTTVTAKINYFVYVNPADLDKLKSDLAKSFGEIERNEATKHADVKKGFHDALVSFRQAMNGEGKQPTPVPTATPRSTEPAVPGPRP